MSKTIKVAIADDHGLFRSGVAQILEDDDNLELILEAKNGKDLITKIAKLPAKERPDVCILDINMPVMSGYDAAKSIRKNHPKIKILALSMFDEEAIVIKMFHSGAHGYALKDIEPAELRKAIRSIYNSGIYYSDVVTNEVLKAAKSIEEDDDIIFSAKELAFLKYCCTEMTYKAMAEKMGISHRTIDGYRDNLFAKLNLKSRSGLVVYAIRTGIVNVLKTTH